LSEFFRSQSLTENAQTSAKHAPDSGASLLCAADFSVAKWARIKSGKFLPKKQTFSTYNALSLVFALSMKREIVLNLE